MAQTVSAFARAFEQQIMDVVGEHEVSKYIGKQLIIPLHLSEEARARHDWNDAIAWLESRKAAEEEWPWPRRSRTA